LELVDGSSMSMARRISMAYRTWFCYYTSDPGSVKIGSLPFRATALSLRAEQSNLYWTVQGIAATRTRGSASVKARPRNGSIKGLDRTLSV
jgi:hypothetical protein